MPRQFHEAVDPSALKNVSYGFFTNEAGVSDGGYVVAGERTRNVNLYSPQEREQVGFDSAKNVIENLMACFKELTAGAEKNPHTHKFVMTSNYGASGARVLTCKTAEELIALKQLAIDEAENLKLHAAMQHELHEHGVHGKKNNG